MPARARPTARQSENRDQGLGVGFRRLFPVAGRSWLELAPLDNTAIRELYALLDEGILEAWISEDGRPEITVAATGERLVLDHESDSTCLNQTPQGGRGRRARGEQVCRRPRFPLPTR